MKPGAFFGSPAWIQGKKELGHPLLLSLATETWIGTGQAGTKTGILLFILGHLQYVLLILYRSYLKILDSSFWQLCSFKLSLILWLASYFINCIL